MYILMILSNDTKTQPGGTVDLAPLTRLSQNALLVVHLQIKENNLQTGAQ